jgi:hypothetical protein
MGSRDARRIPPAREKSAIRCTGQFCRSTCSLPGKWVRAGYVAELHEIAERYAECEITGPAEIRSRCNSASFNPYRRAPADHLPPVEEPPPEPPIEEPPIEDELEHFLVRLFLRRYVT